jgi:hypothetical protein
MPAITRASPAVWPRRGEAGDVVAVAAVRRLAGQLSHPTRARRRSVERAAETEGIEERAEDLGGEVIATSVQHNAVT